MGAAIWKFEVPLEDFSRVDLPCGAQILSVQVQDGTPKMWALVPDTEAEVLELLALDGCIDAIKDAVDTGAIKVSAAAKVAKRSEEDQAAWLAARSTPKAPRAKSDAARPMPPAKVAKLAKEIGKVPSLAPLAALLLGTVRPGDITDPDLRAFGDGGAA